MTRVFLGILASALLIIAAPQSKSKAAAKGASRTKAPAARIDPPPPPPQIATYPLETLKVDGNKRVASARVIAASGLHVGLTVEKADFDQARDRLVATGAFESVGYEYKPNASGSGYDAVLQVIEAPQFFAYRFEDLPAADATLRAVLRKAEPIFEDRIPPSAAVLDRFIRTIQQALGGSADVTSRLAPEDGDSIVIFRPAGTMNNIAEVRFTGNEVLPSTVLTKSLSAVAVGVPFTERNFWQMLDASIRSLYEARGRIRVEFPQVTTEKAAKVEGLVVTTSIKEGPVYKLGTVRLLGVAANQMAEMEKAANWQKGDIVNFDDVNSGVERIRAKLRQTGYLNVKGRVDRDVRDADQTVNLTAAIEPGAQYHMGKLTIEGLDLLSEPVIRKMWQLPAGRPFQPDYPDGFLARVREEGMFDNLGKMRADTRMDDVGHVVDVTLNFAGEILKDRQEREGKQRRRAP